MNEQTEKLRNKIAGRYWLVTTLMVQSIRSNIIDLCITEDGFDELTPTKKTSYYNFADYILKACEKAGLKFTKTQEFNVGGYWEPVEEIKP